MAYGLVIAAVTENNFNAFKNLYQNVESVSGFIKAEKTIMTTHYYLSAGTGNEVLNNAMYELLDTGEIIHRDYWHPYRPPFYTNAETARPRIMQFKAGWKELLPQLKEDEKEYWHMDFDPILEILDYSLENNLALITFLDRPFDNERAKMVKYPID